MIKRLILLGVIALACGAGVRWSRLPAWPGLRSAAAATERLDTRTPTIDAQAGGARVRWEPVWTLAAPQLATASLAADGTNIAWIDTSGIVRRVDTVTGRVVWETPPMPGMNRVVAAPGGDVFVYSYLNRLQPSVRILDRQLGAAKGAWYLLDGAVWSAAIGSGGRLMFVGTGKGTIYAIPIRAAVGSPFVRPTTWSAGGIPEDLAASAGGQVALSRIWETRTLAAWKPGAVPADPGPVVVPAAGAREPAGGAPRPPNAPVAVADTVGARATGSGPDDAVPLWRADDAADAQEPNGTPALAVSSNGETAVSMSVANTRGDAPVLSVRDGHTGSLLWQEQLQGSDAKFDLSADGRFVAVTWAEMSEYHSGGVLEHKLAIYTREGKKLFADKGGLFFTPEMVAISGDGNTVTVQSGRSTLYTLDDRGDFRARLTLPDDPVTHAPPVIRDCIASDDGRTLLILRGDGSISLYHATGP